MANPEATGKAVLNIYNSRIAEARHKHKDLRLLVFVRNWESQEFTLFERTIVPYAVNDYSWTVNKNDNLEAFHDGKHVFTWQPHGSQFTVILPIPKSAARFRLTKTVPQMGMETALQFTGFESKWIEVIKP